MTLPLKAVLLIVALSYLCARAESSENITINTKCGPMSGLFDPAARLYSFMGVRYGQNTGGSNRWRLPLAAPCWVGTYNATSALPRCFQPSPSPLTVSEDCLFLDIYTRSLPAKTKPLLPVVFWIHGGGNMFGSSRQYGNIFNFAIEFDVLVVSVNFRLGLLGYLALAELAEEDPRGVSGNYGISDCLLALRWVQTHIADFGGDPKRVMLFGQSSGATNIFALLASTQAKGLFSSAVALSGSPNISMSHSEADSQNRPLIPLFGCDKVPNNEIIKCLRGLSPQTIANLTPACFNSNVGGLPNWCALTIADGVLVKPLLPSLRAGLIDVPLLIQNMALESVIDGNVTMLNNTSDSQMKAIFQGYFESNGWPTSAYDKFFELYSPAFDISPGYAYYNFLTDIQFTCGLHEVARAAGQGFKSPVYLSRLMTDPSKPFPGFTPDLYFPYAFHIMDYIMAFKWWFFPSNTSTYSPSKSDLTLGEINLKAWYNILMDLSPSWRSVQSTPGFPKNLSVGYFPRHSPYPRTIVNLDAEKCEALRAPPLSFDQTFWCIN